MRGGPQRHHRLPGRDVRGGDPQRPHPNGRPVPGRVRAASPSAGSAPSPAPSASAAPPGHDAGRHRLGRPCRASGTATDPAAGCGPSTAVVDANAIDAITPPPTPVLPVTVHSADGRDVTVTRREPHPARQPLRLDRGDRVQPGPGRERGRSRHRHHVRCRQGTAAGHDRRHRPVGRGHPGPGPERHPGRRQHRPARGPPAAARRGHPGRDAAVAADARRRQRPHPVDRRRAWACPTPASSS